MAVNQNNCGGAHSDSTMTCDQAFAKYLIYLSKKVREAFYVRALKYVLLYRDFLNNYNSNDDPNLQGNKTEKHEF